MQKLSQAPAVANTSSRLTQLGLRSSCSKCCSTLRGLLTKSEEGRLAPVHATLQALGCQNLADVNQDLWGNHNLLHSPEAHKHLSVWLIHYLDHEKHKKKRPRCLPFVLWWQSKRVLEGCVALASVSTAGAMTEAQFCILVPLPSAICKLRRVTVMLNMLSGSNKGSRGVPLLQTADVPSTPVTERSIRLGDSATMCQH